jgi:hypothetical protein
MQEAHLADVRRFATIRLLLLTTTPPLGTRGVARRPICGGRVRTCRWAPSDRGETVPRHTSQPALYPSCSVGVHAG